jgi:hypothetical protein
MDHILHDRCSHRYQSFTLQQIPRPQKSREFVIIRLLRESGISPLEILLPLRLASDSNVCRFFV